MEPDFPSYVEDSLCFVLASVCNYSFVAMAAAKAFRAFKESTAPAAFTDVWSKLRLRQDRFCLAAMMGGLNALN